MSGWLPLSAAELTAWANLTGAIVTPEEWQIIRDMDLAFLRAAAKRSGDLPRGNEQEINTEAFDAVFG